MPANWTKGSKKKEAAWERAKKIVEKDDKYKDMPEDRKYAIMMTIAKNIYKGK